MDVIDDHIDFVSLPLPRFFLFRICASLLFFEIIRRIERNNIASLRFTRPGVTGSEKKGSFVYGLYTAPNPERNEIAVTPKIPIRRMKNASVILSSTVASLDGMLLSSFDVFEDGRFVPNLQNPKRKRNIAETFIVNANDPLRFEFSINVFIVN